MKHLKLLLIVVVLFFVAVTTNYAIQNYPKESLSSFSYTKHAADNVFTRATSYLLSQQADGKSIQIACDKNDSWYTFVGFEYYGYPETLRWSLDPNNLGVPTADIVVGCNQSKMEAQGYKLINTVDYGDIKIYMKSI